MILNNVNQNKLHQELINAGIEVDKIKVFTLMDDVHLTLSDDVDMQLAQSIIDAHDPTPIPPAPTQDDFLIDLELRMTILELGITL